MSTTQKSSTGSTVIGIVIGAVLMIGGYFVSVQTHDSDALKKLAESGVPLDPGMTVSTIGVFLILFPVLNSFFFKPLSDAISTRSNDLEDTFEEAESLRQEMATMKVEYEKRLAETEANAREQIQNQIKEAQQLKAILMSEASSKADALVQKAMQEIAVERDRLIVELRTHVVDVTLSAAEKVINENMDNDRNRRLIAEFINTVEVAH